MYIMPKQEILSKLDRLLSVPKCKDVHYKRKQAPQELREELIKESKGICYVCKAKPSVPFAHHIRPDGDNEKDNLVILCTLCHRWVHWILKKYFGYRAAFNVTKYW